MTSKGCSTDESRPLDEWCPPDERRPLDERRMLAETPPQRMTMRRSLSGRSIGSLVVVALLVLTASGPSGLLTSAGAQVASSAARTAQPPAAPPLTDSAFAALSAALSEAGGYFDTDNLISNETSYLHVLAGLREAGIEGGAYLGVGPGQNFSYIAEFRPRLAFIIDIRRDNLLHHLLYKALFEVADSRADFLALLVGREPPPDPWAWADRSIDELVAWIDAQPLEPDVADRARQIADSAVATLGIPLSREDLATIGRFHGVFIRGGLDLRYRSYGRPPRPYYPTFRQLLLETDLTGRQANYLASPERYRVVRDLQRANRVIPVVGDLAGDYAMRSIGDTLRARDLRVTAFYTSNVEFYLYRAGTFDRFAANVVTLPTAADAVLIRSYFPSGGDPHPHRVPGYWSTQLLQPVDAFVRAMAGGGFLSYRDLVTRDAIDPRRATGAGPERPFGPEAMR